MMNLIFRDHLATLLFWYFSYSDTYTMGNAQNDAYHIQKAIYGDAHESDQIATLHTKDQILGLARVGKILQEAAKECEPHDVDFMATLAVNPLASYTHVEAVLNKLDRSFQAMRKVYAELVKKAPAVTYSAINLDTLEY